MKWSAQSITRLINTERYIPEPIELEAVEAMMQRGSIASFDNHQYITRKGDGHPRLCVMLSGYARLTAFTEDGKEMLSHFIQPGDCWGAHPCLGDFDETNDGIAEAPCEVLIVSAEDVNELMWEFRSFQRAMVKVLCSRLNLAVQVASQLGVHNSSQRLAWRLSLMSKNAHPGSFTSEISVSQESLAAMIGLTRQRTNFLLRELEKDGVIALRYNKIEILDIERLKAMSAK